MSGIFSPSLLQEVLTTILSFFLMILQSTPYVGRMPALIKFQDRQHCENRLHI